MESSIQVGYVPIIDPESTSSGSEGEYDGSDSDISQELLTSNVGVMYEYQGQDERLLDQRRAQEHIEFRNKYFTPDITRHKVVIYSETDNYNPLNVNLCEFGFDIDRVIGFKLVKARIAHGGAGGNLEITIPEIPYITCKKNKDNKSIIEVVYSSDGDQYYENKDLYRDVFFNPIKLSNLNISVTDQSSGALSFYEFEITTLNRSF
jgi:hypothetical protein